MTEKQTKALQIMAKGVSKRQAMLQAGYSDSTARNPSKVLKTSSIQQQLAKALKKYNISIQRTIAPINDALNATRIAVDKQSGKYYDTGIPDHPTRLKAVTMAHKLLNIDTVDTVNPSQLNDSKSILNAMQDSNEVELYKAVFNKQSEVKETVKK